MSPQDPHGNPASPAPPGDPHEDTDIPRTLTGDTTVPATPAGTRPSPSQAARTQVGVVHVPGRSGHVDEGGLPASAVDKDPSGPVIGAHRSQYGPLLRQSSQGGGGERSVLPRGHPPGTGTGSGGRGTLTGVSRALKPSWAISNWKELLSADWVPGGRQG